MRATIEAPSQSPVDEALPAPASPGRMLLALAVSGSALALLFHAYVGTAPAPAELEPEESEPIEEAPPSPAPASVAAQGVVEGALPPITTPSVTAPTPAPVVAPDPAAVVVPDFASMRVPAARRHARELGLRLVIRDPYGLAIDRYDAPRYLVRRQHTEPGAAVPRGSTVRLVAEDPSPPVMGY